MIVARPIAAAALVGLIGVWRPLAQSPVGGSISGVVVDDRGERVTGARVGLVDGRNATTRSTLSDPEGRFAINSIPPAPYTLGVMKSGYGSVMFGQVRTGTAGVTIPVRAGEVRHLTVVLPRGAVISGVVRDSFGRSRADAWVRAYRLAVDPKQAPNQESATRTSSTGQYRLWGLSPGSFVIEAFIDIGDSLEFVFEDQKGRDRTMIVPRTFYPGVTAKEMAVRVPVVAGQHISGIDLTLTTVPAGRIEGTVLPRADVRHDPGSVQIHLNGEAAYPFVQPARVDKQGRFFFRGIAAGRHALLYETLAMNPARIEQSLKYWGLADVVVTPDETAPVILTVLDGVTITGRLELAGSSDVDISRLWYDIVPVKGPFAGYPLGGYGEERDGRQFSLRGLPPGEYSVRVNSTPPGWWLASALVGTRDILDFPIELAAGSAVQDLRVTFTNQPAGVVGHVVASDGTPRWDREVVVFPVDRLYWMPRARRIRMTQPDLDGQFELARLAPGEYWIALNHAPDRDFLNDPLALDGLIPMAARISARMGTIVRQNITVR
jgi:hypothetical protein